MNDQSKMKALPPVPTVEILQQFAPGDLEDLCDATIAAIDHGGGFGWVNVPEREVLERYWEGVLAMPRRVLFVARLDGVICGTCQIMKPPPNNEAQAHAVELTTNFVAPWARGHGLANMLLEEAEKSAKAQGFSVVNLSVRETAETAITLYEERGYTQCGVHPNYAIVDGKTLRGFYYFKAV